VARHTNLSRPPDPTEDDIQAAFIEIVRLNVKHHKELKLCYHVPNGGGRSKAEGMKMKALGVERGAPDINVDVARGAFHGLRLEFKRGGRGVVSDDQKDWHENLIEQGYFVAVVRSVEEALDVTARYMQKQKDDLFRDRPQFDRWNGAC
jgi:hypothetical protein